MDHHQQTIISAPSLKQFCEEVFAQRIPREEAARVADNLVEADLLGFSSHGVCKVSDYLQRLDKGLIENRTELKKVTESSTASVLDASNGWGQYASVEAMEKAKQYGTGVVGVRNSNHFGITSYYTMMAARKGCIGFASTNASGLMVPFGSREPSLGTNPISIAVPAGEGRDPIVLDMSTGNTARGKITLAKKTGDAIPEDWAVTKDGKRTSDPAEALEGYLLPMGPKGSGLAIMVDILSGVLTGALFGSGVPRMYEDPEPQYLGHLFGAIDVKAFMEESAFYEKIMERVAQTVESEPMGGFDRVYLPGEREQEKRRAQLEEGICLPHEIFAELKHMGEVHQVDISQFVKSDW
ncbi:Ldh family oxidoreductase [Salibacterium aidingense]|uniref:Ldh family oxidoreductase n=1 Tax=Salibacterium aidingense TaxID=384933 RepID=UPI003BC96F31